MGAIGLLREIVSLAPGDFYAYEFMSYSYAVLDDAPAAANVDVDIVAMFDSEPAASGVVAAASNRLSIWDPEGWQEKVAARKAALGRY
jgi:hypothetical protein